MKIFDTRCPSCQTAYEVAESTSATGSPGRVQCSVCGGLLAAWQEPSTRVYRLSFPIERKYPRVPVPPAPVA